jgi:chromosome segregation and condensation protein ScpB
MEGYGTKMEQERAEAVIEAILFAMGESVEISKLRKEGVLESEKNRFTLL